MKLIVTVAVAIVIALGILGSSQGVMGNATPVAEPSVNNSSLIGTWQGGEADLLYSFAAGGTAIARSGDGEVYLGAWLPDDSGGATFDFALTDANGFGQGFRGWARLGDAVDEILIGEETLTRMVPPSREDLLAR